MLTGDRELLSQARIVSLHGMSHGALSRYEQGGSWRYDVVLPGFKYNMSDIQASLGLCQLRRLPDFQKRRTEIANQYSAVRLRTWTPSSCLRHVPMSCTPGIFL